MIPTIDGEAALWKRSNLRLGSGNLHSYETFHDSTSLCCNFARPRASDIMPPRENQGSDRGWKAIEAGMVAAFSRLI